MTRNWLTTGGLALAAILFVAVNVLAMAAFKGARADLTANDLYTLSSGTKNVLKGLKEPVTIRFFFSEKLSAQVPGIRVYGNRVRELLEEYAAHAGGKLRLEVIDPEPFSDSEDQALQAGIQGVPLNSEGDKFYFGLAGTNSTDDRQAIPFFQMEREEFLEYDVTKLVNGLNEPKKPIIGVLTSLPLDGGAGDPMAMMHGGRPGQTPPWQAYEHLKQLFEVKMLDPAAAVIPDDIKVLLVAHLAPASQAAQYAIDQFVLKGGKALFFVDPNAESLGGPMAGSKVPPTSMLDTLFNGWGIQMDPNKVVGDRDSAQRVGHQGSGGGQRVLDYVVWLKLNKTRFAADDVVTGQLNAINMATAGALSLKEGSALSFQPLIQTSPQAMLVDTAKIRFSPDPEGLLRGFVSDNKPYVVAARVSGSFKTAFPDGPPPEPAKDPKAEAERAAAGEKPVVWPAKDAHLKEGQRATSVIVVGDSDMLDDRFWIQVQDFFGQKVGVPLADNADFLINAIDQLTGSEDLIGLRSRGRSARPFDVVEGLRRDAEIAFLSQEKALRDKMVQTQRQLDELQGGGDKDGKAGDASGAKLVTPEQEAAIAQFRDELLATRKQLRDVQHNLNREIEGLQRLLLFVNVGLVPLLLGALALLLAWSRRQRRTGRVQA